MMLAVGLILGLAAVLFSLAPMLFSREVEEMTASTGAAEVEHLEARKNRLVEGIHDLDFEYASGKVADEDYRAAREELMRDAALVLQRLEKRTSDEMDRWIDREVQARRARERPDGLRVTAAVPATEKCPSCKTPLAAGARFCDHCGESVARRCNACDTELRDEARFCGQCGIAV